MSRQENSAQISGYHGHCIFFRPGEMSQEFRVAGKTVASKEECTLVYGRRGNRIDASRRAQFDSCLDVTGSRFTGGAGFNSRFNKPGNVVEMKNDWIDEIRWQRLSVAHNVIARLQIKRARRVSQQLGVPDDHRHAAIANLFLCYGLKNDFRTDSGRVAHCDTDARQRTPRPGPEMR